MKVKIFFIHKINLKIGREKEVEKYVIKSIMKILTKEKRLDK